MCEKNQPSSSTGLVTLYLNIISTLGLIFGIWDRPISFSNQLYLAQVDTNHVWKNQLFNSYGLVTLHRHIISTLGLIFGFWDRSIIFFNELNLVKKISALALMVWSQILYHCLARSELATLCLASLAPHLRTCIVDGRYEAVWKFSDF